MGQRFVDKDDKEEVKLKTHRHGYIDATGRRLEPGEEILHACTDSEADDDLQTMVENREAELEAAYQKDLAEASQPSKKKKKKYAHKPPPLTLAQQAHERAYDEAKRAQLQAREARESDDALRAAKQMPRLQLGQRRAKPQEEEEDSA